MWIRGTYFLKMLDDGGVQTALTFIHSTRVSEGFTALWEKKRLDLTAEALVWHEPWCRLFEEADLQKAARRLSQYGHDVRRNSN